MEEEAKNRFDDFDKRLANAEKRYEDITKNRFDDLDKRLNTSDKRFDDVKLYIGGVTTLFVIIFSVFSYIANHNLTREGDNIRKSLEKAERDIDQRLNQIGGIPQIELSGVNHKPLSNQDVNVKLYYEPDQQIRLNFSYFIKNTSNALSGKMFIKLYSYADLDLGDLSSDENEYAHEKTWIQEWLTPNEIPGMSSIEMSLSLELNTLPKSGKYKVLLKHYYGGEHTETRCNLVISKANLDAAIKNKANVGSDTDIIPVN